MYKIIRRKMAYPVFAYGSSLLWGIIELVALNRSRR